jgi:hypothetical protein
MIVIHPWTLKIIFNEVQAGPVHGNEADDHERTQRGKFVVA